MQRSKNVIHPEDRNGREAIRGVGRKDRFVYRKLSKIEANLERGKIVGWVNVAQARVGRGSVSSRCDSGRMNVWCTLRLACGFSRCLVRRTTSTSWRKVQGTSSLQAFNGAFANYFRVPRIPYHCPPGFGLNFSGSLFAVPRTCVSSRCLSSGSFYEGDYHAPASYKGIIVIAVKTRNSHRTLRGQFRACAHVRAVVVTSHCDEC